MKTFITDEALRDAAKQVRESMLSSLPEEPKEHAFSEEFLETIEELRQSERKRASRASRAALFRRCVAAMLSIVVSLSLFFGLNTEARAAALRWVKQTTWGQTMFSFLGEAEEALPEFEVMWVPEGVELVNEIVEPDCVMRLYSNPDDDSQSFAIQCALMDSDSPLIISHNKSEYLIHSTIVNTHYAELYIAQDSSVSNGLVWFDDGTGVSFTIISDMKPDVILHIAENIKLDISTK